MRVESQVDKCGAWRAKYADEFGLSVSAHGGGLADLVDVFLEKRRRDVF